MFYQIASCGLASANICFPLRREFVKHRNVSYHMGHVKNIDLSAKTVETSYEKIAYDKLVIAAGSTNNYFGMDDLGGPRSELRPWRRLATRAMRFSTALSGELCAPTPRAAGSC